jgi:hypothetical protein
MLEVEVELGLELYYKLNCQYQDHIRMLELELELYYKLNCQYQDHILLLEVELEQEDMMGHLG